MSDVAERRLRCVELAAKGREGWNPSAILEAAESIFQWTEGTKTELDRNGRPAADCGPFGNLLALGMRFEGPEAFAAQRRSYVVLDADGRTVHQAHAENDLSVGGARNSLNWLEGRAPFRVYCAEWLPVGLGFIGETQGHEFADTNYDPDYSRRPLAAQ